MRPTDIPPYSTPGRNRRVLLVRRPAGIPLDGDFAMDEQAVPEPGAGEFLVRNLYLSVDPAQRGWASAEGEFLFGWTLGERYREGALAVDEDITDRIEDAMGALQQLYAGENSGKRLIYVG